MTTKMNTTVTKTNPLGTERIGKLILTFAVPSIISMVGRVSWQWSYQCCHADDGDCHCIKPADW